MKPWKKVVLSISIVLLLFIPFSIANAEDKKDEVYDKPKTVEQGGVTLESKKYSLTHYEVVAHVEESWNPFSGEEINKALLSLANAFFGVTKLLASWIDEAIGILYNVDVLGGVTDKISNVSNNLWEALKENFAATFLTLAVIQIFAVYVGNRNQSKAGKMTFRLITVIVFATVWFGNSGYYLNAMNSLSTASQAVIMKAGTPLANADIKAGEELEGSVALVRNHFFDLAVYRPYLMMAYGTTDEKTINKKQNVEKDSRNRIDELLGLKNSKEGYEKKKEIVQNEVEKLKNENMTIGKIAENIGIAGMSIIFVTGLGVPPLLIALFNFIIQVAVIVLSIGLPVSFILSMIPYFSNSAYKVLGKIVGLFGMKAFTGMIMLFVFFLNNIIQALIPLTSPTAYFLNVLLTTVGTIYIIVKRDMIVTFVTAGHVTTVDAGMPKQIYRQYKTKVEKPAVSAAQKTAAFTQNVASNAGNFAMQKVRDIRASRTPQSKTGAVATAATTAATTAVTAATGPLGGAVANAAATALENRRNKRTQQKNDVAAKKEEVKKPIEIKHYQDNPNYKRQTQKTNLEKTSSTQQPKERTKQDVKSNQTSEMKRPERHTHENLDEKRASKRTVYQPPTNKEEE